MFFSFAKSLLMAPAPSSRAGLRWPHVPHANHSPQPPLLITRLLLCPGNYLCIRRSLTESHYLISLWFSFISNILAGYWCLRMEYSPRYRMGYLLIPGLALCHINKLNKKIKWLSKGMKGGSETVALHASTFPLLPTPLFILQDELER